MGDGHRQHGGAIGFHQIELHYQQQQQQAPPISRQCMELQAKGRRLRGAARGEIVEVQGGHVMRSTGRKDRHSKVCTAKGPRDRRVRLAAHTAIQFYDVQDRLGYDRPSKAVDWLIQNAKTAIDQLAELPPWTPAAASCAPQSTRSPAAEPHSLDSGELPMPATGFSFDVSGDGGNTFLPPSLDSDAIADTIKSFFPTAAAASAVTSSPDLQDLRLSLQSLQEPIFRNSQSSHNSLLLSSSHLGFDAAAAAGWAEHSQRIAAPWNVAETSGVGIGGLAFHLPPPQAMPLHSILGPGQLRSQRGTLQSSNSPSARGWAAGSVATPAELQMYPVLQPSASSSGFSGFRIPRRIQGEEEEHRRGICDKPPSASRH
ncbi:hypothetical protein Cni_G09476 [Canna indica]|uniref:TCP domain-containing protein n=1 Tax=Canna indica TaxID=4628 RepID=A0AAQ3Q9C4_9LILI|nr:hypothetical protein Cni_G09476 [Canna indica]